MAHYAFLDENNVVIEVITGKDEGEDGIDWEAHYGAFRGKVCKRTSYNTHANEHPNGTPFRKNYACIGFVYRDDIDGFIEPQPFPSWTLNINSGVWEPPIPKPSDRTKMYRWNEETQSWEEFGYGN